MVANPIWIAGYGGTPTGGAAPVWIVGYGGAIAGAAESWIAGYGGTPAAGASKVWIAGYGGTPTGGAAPIWIGGYLTSGIGVLPGSPVNTVAPVASGSLTVGSTLSCTTGTWTNSPTGYAYQWQRGGANISGATSSTYVTVSADGGTSVGCLVTATNAIGPGLSAASNILAIAAGGATSVWSAADAAAGSITLTNGGLTAAGTLSSWNSLRSSISKSSGLLYVEFKVTTAVTANAMMFGMANAAFSPSSYLGTSGYSWGVFQASSFSAGFTGGTIGSVPNPASGDVWAIAVNFTTGNVWLAQNNVWFNSGNPATGAAPFTTFSSVGSGPLFAALSFNAPGTGAWTIQPTAASQTYAPPAGFSPWN